MASTRLISQMVASAQQQLFLLPPAPHAWLTHPAPRLPLCVHGLATSASLALQSSPAAMQQEQQQQQQPPATEGGATSTAAAQPQEQQPSPQQQQQQQQQQQPDYAQIRARIFGEPIRPGERTGRRVLARPLQGAQLASWYFLPPRVPGTHNEEAEYVKLRKLNKRSKKKEEAPAAGTAAKKKK